MSRTGGDLPVRRKTRNASHDSQSQGAPQGKPGRLRESNAYLLDPRSSHAARRTTRFHRHRPDASPASYSFGRMNSDSDTAPLCRTSLILMWNPIFGRLRDPDRERYLDPIHHPIVVEIDLEAHLADHGFDIGFLAEEQAGPLVEVEAVPVRLPWGTPRAARRRTVPTLAGPFTSRRAYDSAIFSSRGNPIVRWARASSPPDFRRTPIPGTAVQALVPS